MWPEKKRRLYSIPTGWRLILGKLDKIVLVCLKAINSRCAAINTKIANVTALLSKGIQTLEVILILIFPVLKKSSFKRIMFVKVHIPDGARKEIEHLFHYKIAAKFKRHMFP